LSPLIHIVDDDAQVRAATSYLLTGQGYTTQIYSSGEELLAQPTLRDGCILLDLRMPGLGGTKVMAELSARGGLLPVIMMSGHGDLGDAVAAMKLGAVDFLEKPYQEPKLIAAIERALDTARRSRDRREARSAAAARLERLSPRERQVLQGLLAGMTNKAIARSLQLSPRTVEMHRANMMDDLGLTSLSEAVRLAIDAELSPLDGADEADKAPPSTSSEGLQNDRPAAPEQPDTKMLPEVLDVLEGTTECVFLLDDDWRFTYLNRNAAEMIGSRKDLRGKVIWEAFPLAVGTRAWEQLHRVASDRQPLRFQFFEPDLELWLDVNARPIGGGLQVFFRDVSAERKVPLRCASAKRLCSWHWTRRETGLGIGTSQRATSRCLPDSWSGSAMIPKRSLADSRRPASSFTPMIWIGYRSSSAIISKAGRQRSSANTGCGGAAEAGAGISTGDG
jgi:two-component system response regulator FixJ